MHIKGSGLKRGKDQTEDFVCKRCCSSGSQQKEPHVAEWAVSGHPIPEPNTDANGPNSRGSCRFSDKSYLAWPEKSEIYARESRSLEIGIFIDSRGQHWFQSSRHPQFRFFNNTREERTVRNRHDSCLPTAYLVLLRNKSDLDESVERL